MKRPSLAAGLALLAGTLFAADTQQDFSPQPPVKILSPEEELKTIQVPPGYKLELVLSERDDVKEPVNVTFDGNGRMYVIEMRSYMQDVDGTHEHDPVSRVSRHWSSKGDGVFDKHSVFADKLMLARMVLPLDDRVLINETDTLDIYSYKDNNGDGVSDKKEMWFQAGPRAGNLEHQQSGLIWAMDNWIYQTYNAWRLRPQGKTVRKESTPANGGQWGLCQDDWGKVWWSNAGAERGLYHFQTPIIYGAFDVPGQIPPDFLEVWPAVGLADVQGGPARFRPADKTLNHVTASCGQQIVRGDRMPADLRGDVLLCEPVGRLIRRAKIEVKDGITTLSNPDGHSEFIRSTDPMFRPVNITSGPDGCLYIVDMYRGIIQEGNWTREGSYLRKVVQQHSLDKIIGHGRIWRLVHEDFKPGPQPRMLDETPAQLVAHLEHPNGWWRDTAQKLLVLKGDKSVGSALAQMARTSKNPLARIHALWTLEGLDALNPELVRAFLKDKDPQIRVQGIRVAETLMTGKSGASLIADVKALAEDTDPSVVLQVLMTGKRINWPDYSKFAAMTMAASSQGVQQLGMLVLNGSQGVAGQGFTRAEIAVLEKGQTIYSQLCFACHGFDGKGMPLEGTTPGATIAPPLAGSKELLSHRDAAVYVLLNGFAGPVNGKTYDAQMVQMDTNDDEWIAAIVSFVRNSFGNHGALVSPADVARIRAGTKNRTTPWTVEELKAVLPQPLASTDGWKATASNNAANAMLAIDGKADTRWDTHAHQVAGQWFQVELPQAVTITGLHLDQGTSAADYPRNYKVETSTDGKAWTKVAQGKGTGNVTEINFPPVKAKLIKITQTGKGTDLFWSIHELRVLQPPSKLAVANQPAPEAKP